MYYQCKELLDELQIRKCAKWQLYQLCLSTYTSNSTPHEYTGSLLDFHAMHIVPSSALCSSSTCALLCQCFLRTSAASIQSKYTSKAHQYHFCTVKDKTVYTIIHSPLERNFLIAKRSKIVPVSALSTGRRKLLI